MAQDDPQEDAQSSASTIGEVSERTRVKAASLLERLENTLDELATLQVITMVTTLDIKPPETKEEKFKFEPTEGTVQGMLTEINLAVGDARNFISPEFLTPDRKTLLELHNEQVTMSREIIAENIKAVIELAKWLKQG